MRRSALIALAVATVCTPAPARSSPTGDAFALFLKARDFWASQRYPALVSYDVAVRIDEGKGERVERYTSFYDVVHHEVHVDPVSDYEIANPASGRGIDVNFIPLGGRVRLTKPQPPIDFLGVPMLAPTYDFGISRAPAQAQPSDADLTPAQLVEQIRKQFHDPARTAAASTPTPSGMREIATVEAFERDYAVAFDGEDTIDGHDCYKLKLDPLRDPHRFRLRELWIDKVSSATWKLREALNFVDGPGTTGPWDVTFASIEGAQYVQTESALTPMAYGGLIYRHTDVSFENIRATDPPRFYPGTLWAAPLVMREPEN